MLTLTEILDNPAANGVYRAASCPGHTGIIHIDAAVHADKNALLKAIGEGLKFPDYYGMNWDALEECLYDMAWWTGPVAVCIDHTEVLAPEVLNTLKDIWTEVAASWAEAGRGFVLILAGAGGLEGLPEVSTQRTVE